jgi:ABC-type dipeptide/oligopeptide/nickel transport system ATPase subunit
MIIKNINIHHFKFHQNLELNTENKNCLIYGENGTGKSSIYWALYSKFNNLDINLYKNYHTNQLPSVDIEFNENNLIYAIQNNQNTIYFANQETLDNIIYKDENKYYIIESDLKNDFQLFDNLHDTYKEINEEVNSENIELKIELKNNNDKNYKYLLNSIELRANDIIRTFGEDFIITLDFEEGLSDTMNDYKFSNPAITIKINEKNSIRHNFNEAKLKLTSISIYFALIRIEEDLTNSFKLLVLDDFLTSLDMSNRKLIVRYILENFSEYQKIILTHNLQFFILINKLLHLNSENELWIVRKLYLYKNKSYLYEKNNNYLEDAEEMLSMGDLQSSGNFIRKEFERIINEFEQLLQLGRVEDLQNIIDSLKSLDTYYVRPHERINITLNKINELLSSSYTNQRKINMIKSNIKKMEKSEIDFMSESTNINVYIKKAEFYKNFILNPASHDDIDAEMYTKECNNAIKLLSYLNKIITNLKGTKFE